MEKWSPVVMNSSNTHPLPNIDPAPSLTQLQSCPYPDPELEDPDTVCTLMPTSSWFWHLSLTQVWLKS